MDVLGILHVPTAHCCSETAEQAGNTETLRGRVFAQVFSICPNVW